MMDTDMESKPEYPTILCCACGTPIQPNPSNMCLLCIQSNVNVTQDLVADGTVQFCKHCGRYLQPPKYWVACAPESKELLTICLKKIRGLSKLRLIDANFIWTEPHSKRIKVKVTVQKEIFSGTVIQQSTVLEMVVMYQMCEYCQKVQTGQDIWTAVVQARQRVDHKKTFLYLEQIILKNKMHQNCTRISEVADGLDFYYSHKGHAQSMVDYLCSIAPLKYKMAEELVSHDTKSNTAEVHHTFAVELAHVCKDDLVCLPKQFSNSMGGLGPITICLKINTNVVLVDPNTLRVGSIPGALYWKSPFESLCSSKRAIEFYVMDIEIIDANHSQLPQSRAARRQAKLSNSINGSTGNTPSQSPAPSVVSSVSGRKGLALAQIQVCKADEVGQDIVYCARTHLGNQLKVGDSALGYFLPQLNFNNDCLNQYKGFSLPDVVLIKRFRPKSKHRRRPWHLKELPNKEFNMKKAEQLQRERDVEEFCDDLELDADYRTHVNLYRNKGVSGAAAAASSGAKGKASMDDDEAGEDDDEENEEDADNVPFDELMSDEEGEGDEEGEEGEEGEEDEEFEDVVDDDDEMDASG